MQESPIFLKTHDMIKWILEHTIKFPKSQRFVMAKRVETCVLNFYDLLIAAAKDGGNVSHLKNADIELERLKHHIRLCRDLKLFSVGQYKHVALMEIEVGKLLGGWLNKIKQKQGERSEKPPCSSRGLVEQQRQEHANGQP